MFSLQVSSLSSGNYGSLLTIYTEPGAIAERSNPLDRGRGYPSSNPGKGCYGDVEQFILHI